MIPFLGAVPDCAIIVASSLGPAETLPAKIAVGVGTLAGSTALLLTLPWAASVYIGRRDLDLVTGEAATYTDEKGVTRPMLTEFSWSQNVVTTGANVPIFARIMMLTSLSYLVVQLPAFFYRHDKDSAHEEKPYALAGLISALCMLVYYSYYQLADARYESMLAGKQKAAERRRWKRTLGSKFSHVSAFHRVFEAHDVDSNGYLDRGELFAALRSLGLAVDRAHMAHIIKDIDENRDGKIDEREFVGAVASWMNETSSLNLAASGDPPAVAYEASGDYDGGGEYVAKPAPAGADRAASGAEDSAYDDDAFDNEKPSPSGSMRERLLVNINTINGGGPPSDGGSANGEEEEEAEEEFIELTDGQLILRACGLLLLGTALVVFFSDPMVDVIGGVGNSIGVSPFYVSFVVTPLASNASEIISAIIFARKKTNRAMSLTLSSLYGAASMNNTLGLSIFFALIYFRHLSWDYSAEVLSILFVTIGVGLNSMRRTIRLWQAALVAALFPLSIGLVVLLEHLGLK